MCICVCMHEYTEGGRGKANMANVTNFSSCSGRCACTILSTLPASVFDNFHNTKCYGTNVPACVSPTRQKALPPRTHASGCFPQGGPLLPAGAKLVCCLLPPLPAMPGPSVLLCVAGVVGWSHSCCSLPEPCSITPTPPFTLVSITVPRRPCSFQIRLMWPL